MALSKPSPDEIREEIKRLEEARNKLRVESKELTRQITEWKCFLNVLAGKTPHGFDKAKHERATENPAGE